MKLTGQNGLYESDNWLEEVFKQMDKAEGDSHGQEWVREELYLTD